ncbi:MAG: T9SS type A sorting domain-containing protein [Prevotellaceae bacterium]|jgi:hypothetical protein|nr:T9SS type A sorting domain-containing protein [Prevotellaceae bacterium]
MKRNLLFAVALLCATMQTKAQEVFMAVGTENSKQIDFKEVKSLNVSSFDDGRALFAKQMLKTQFADATDKCNCDPNSPAFIAALTVDGSGNVVAMNMAGTQIYRYLQNGDVQTIAIAEATKTFREGDLFARMTTSPDGAIYALNNSGSHLLKITADGQLADLGAIDGFAEIFRTFADKRSAYGGDMIADDTGNLLVFTALGNVVKIDTKANAAEFMGQVTGLPEGYTVNGVAVTDNNDVIVASSHSAGLYAINPKALTSSFFGESNMSVYDLASRNFLKHSDLQLAENDLVLYPTLVKQDKFVSIASQKEHKDATVEMYATDGKLITKQVYSIKTGDNKFSVNNLSSGIYIVKVADRQGNSLLVEKFTIQ